MPVATARPWENGETYGTYGSILPVSAGRRSKFAFWDAIGVAGRSLVYRDDLEYVRNLGEGSQFVVDLYKYTPSTWEKETDLPELLAVKTAKVRAANTASSVHDRHDLWYFIREIQILQYGPVRTHPNIVQLISSTWKEDSGTIPIPQMVVEYTPLGNLSEYLQNLPVNIKEKLAVAYDVSSGLNSLHTAGIVHGDVKLVNIMVFPADDGVVAKLSDFGCTITVNDEAETRLYHGTRSYMPPDAKEGCPLSMEELMKCEVFVFGLCVWEILNNGKRFSETSEQTQASPGKQCIREDFDDFITAELHRIHRDSSEDIKVTKSTAVHQNILKELQKIVQAMLKPHGSSRPAMQRVADTLQNLVSAFKSTATTTTRTAPLGTRFDFGGQYFIWKYSDPQSDLPYNIQSQAVQTLEEMLPSFSNDELGYAYTLLSYCVAHGYGVPVNFLKALEYLVKALEFGFEPAQFLVPRILSAITESANSNVEHVNLQILSAKAKSYMSPAALSLDASVNAVTQEKSYNEWWIRLKDLGLQKQRGLQLTLLTRTGSHQIMPPVEPEKFLQLMRNHGVDLTDSLIQAPAERGRTPPPTHALHFLVAQGWHELLKEFKVGGERLQISIRRLSWYTGVMEQNINLLFSAAMCGMTDTVLYLLQNAVIPDPSNPNYETFDIQTSINGLHFLGMFPEASIDKVAISLLETGADPNKSDNIQTFWMPYVLEGFPLLLGGGPPLDTAIWLRSVKAVKTLLALGADPFRTAGPVAIRFLRHTPLQLAVSLHHFEIVEIMLEYCKARNIPNYAEDLLLWVSGELVGGKDLWKRWVMHGPDWRMAVKRTIDLCIAHGANVSAHRYDGATPLALACQKHPCQVYIVEALLEAGCDPNEYASNDQGVLPIHTCLWEYWGDADACRIYNALAKRNANFNLCSLRDGLSSMHNASLLNWPETLKFLSDNGAAVDIRDKDGSTPLMMAVQSGDEASDSVRQLLQLGAKVDIAENSGRTALQKAIIVGALDSVKLLLEHGADVDAVTELYKANGLSCMNSLELAAFWGRIPVFEAVLHYVPNYKPSSDVHVLSAAVKGSELEMLKFLLRQTNGRFQNLLLQYDAVGNNLLHSTVAVTSTSVDREIVRELHRAGMPIDLRLEKDPEDLTRTALALAVQSGHVEMVCLLLELGATPYCRGDPKRKSWTFLHEAAVFAQSQASEDIRKNFDKLLSECEHWIVQNEILSSKDFMGRTPLHAAAQYGQAAMVESLIRVGSDVNARVGTSEEETTFNMTGMTALQLAYEFATFPAKSRASNITDQPGASNDDLRAVIKYLKTVRASHERRKVHERFSWQYRKLRRHSRVMVTDIHRTIMRSFTRKR